MAGAALLPFAFAGAFAAGLAATAVMTPTPRLLWNLSPSVPTGLYALRAAGPELRRGDMVVLRPPRGIALLAATRGYLPEGIPLVKRVAAIDGDRVCSDGRYVRLNGRIAASRRNTDRAGRPMPGISACRRLGRNDVLVLGDTEDSFDGRYFGPVDRTDVIARAIPLWTD